MPTVECEHCGMMISNKANLKRHIRLKHGEVTRSDDDDDDDESSVSPTSETSETVSNKSDVETESEQVSVDEDVPEEEEEEEDESNYCENDYWKYLVARSLEDMKVIPSTLHEMFSGSYYESFINEMKKNEIWFDEMKYERERSLISKKLAKTVGRFENENDNESREKSVDKAWRKRKTMMKTLLFRHENLFKDELLDRQNAQQQQQQQQLEANREQNKNLYFV
jgi:hypothetical protein